MEWLEKIIKDGWELFDATHEKYKVVAKERDTEAMFMLMKETAAISEVLGVLLNLKIEMNKKG